MFQAVICQAGVADVMHESDVLVSGLFWVLTGGFLMQSSVPGHDPGSVPWQLPAMFLECNGQLIEHLSPNTTLFCHSC